MPLTRCEDDGRPGWKWGDAGKCYVYTVGDDASEAAARKKALAQAAAMGEFPGTGQNRASDTVEVLHRSTVPAGDVDFKERIIDVVAVPWNEEAEIEWRNEIWREMFIRGAFNEAIQESVRIPVNLEHDRRDTVGRIVRMQDDTKGLLASVKVAKTFDGDKALALAADGVYGASVGYFVRKMSDVLVNRQSMLRRVRRAFLDHLAMTAHPTWRSAETLAVRSDLETSGAGLQPLITPGLDEWMSDPVLGWAAARVGK